MLVLDYGIECDLLEEGNVKIVDGEIEITSETFLRELGKRIHDGVVRATIDCEDIGWITLETDNAFADTSMWEDLLCLPIHLNNCEISTLLDAAT